MGVMLAAGARIAEMSRRLVLATVWLVAIGAVAFTAVLLTTLHGPPVRMSGLTAIVDGSGQDPPKPAERWRWRVVRSLSAHHVMVIEVETSALGDAKAISAQLVEPVKSSTGDPDLLLPDWSAQGTARRTPCPMDPGGRLCGAAIHGLVSRTRACEEKACEEKGCEETGAAGQPGDAPHGCLLHEPAGSRRSADARSSRFARVAVCECGSVPCS